MRDVRKASCTRMTESALRTAERGEPVAAARWPAPGRLAAAIAAAIALLAVAGIAHVALDPPEAKPWSLFSLETELTFPAAFSAALLVGAGACALLAGRRRAYGVHPSWYLFAALLIGMGVDEAAYLHERLESASGVDWQLLYAPVALVCGAAWLRLTYALRSFRPAQLLMVLGAGAWLAAQVLENVQWGADGEKVAGYSVLMVIEEILEMSGSALFLVAVYAALWAAGALAPARRG